MEIFEENPKDWKDLQDKVAYVLQNCGYIVVSPKTINSLRGNVELDVYAYNEYFSIACECKNWNSNIPQNVVFSFRTILFELGINKGLIIAKKGFQNGAYNQIKDTNISLFTWEEFLNFYKKDFLNTKIKNFLKYRSKLYRISADKREYWEYTDNLTLENQALVFKLQDQLFKVSSFYFSIVIRLGYEQDVSVENIDMEIKKYLEENHLEIKSYSRFFEYIDDSIRNIIVKLERLYGINLLDFK